MALTTRPTPRRQQRARLTVTSPPLITIVLSTEYGFGPLASVHVAVHVLVLLPQDKVVSLGPVTVSAPQLPPEAVGRVAGSVYPEHRVVLVGKPDHVASSGQVQQSALPTETWLSGVGLQLLLIMVTQLPLLVTVMQSLTSLPVLDKMQSTGSRVARPPALASVTWTLHTNWFGPEQEAARSAALVWSDANPVGLASSPTSCPSLMYRLNVDPRPPLKQNVAPGAPFPKVSSLATVGGVVEPGHCVVIAAVEPVGVYTESPPKQVVVCGRQEAAVELDLACDMHACTTGVRCSAVCGAANPSRKQTYAAAALQADVISCSRLCVQRAMHQPSTEQCT
jgi:hypothetical protein